MAKFLKNHGITNAIEDLIRNASRRLVLISPYLQLSDAIKRTLEAKMREGLAVQMVYRADNKQPDDIQWFQQQRIPTLGLDDLHTKCYLSESQCIITSMNLYQYSQVHNLEMGISIDRKDDAVAYGDVVQEVSHILDMMPKRAATLHSVTAVNANKSGKLSEAQLAKKLGLNETDLKKRMAAKGYLKLVKNSFELTDKGLAAGGEWQPRRNGGIYRIWPADLKL
ncbi:phospholipase D-like domain-containing protein [Methylomonas sp. SURF-2]|uniref:Phospholipase D-like domain-containing protein n=1 Tax=Methylomonas subterranea TaxID=2952225 RepID=A0ABT1TE49_9GAMM|nr:phospholipase D-like domain-containing protein [Methylomonas sp. SURF-2]MCQ8103548.1 phospholipase D-like domain-containing protein [Methylomonas sp. SURF-2]